VTGTECEQQAYEPPALEVLGTLTGLAEGAGPGGKPIVMATGIGIPGGAEEPADGS
jgi:hypothetical protein